MRSSAIFLVSVVTSTRSSRSVRLRISPIRSSICPLVGLTTTCGSTSPVGRMTCSTNSPPVWLSSYGPGVADRYTVCPIRSANSSQVSGRLSTARRQPEPEIDEVALARHVALVHAADLRHRHMRLVDDEQEVLREVVDQRGGCRAGRAAVDMPRIVLDAGAEADLTDHLEVVLGPHPQPLRLQQFALLLQFGEPLLELLLDSRRPHAPSAPAPRRSEWPGRCAASRPCGPHHRSADAGSTAPRPRRRRTRCAPRVPRRTG